MFLGFSPRVKNVEILIAAFII